MIQDILPLQMENQYENRKPGAYSRVMAFLAEQIYIKKGDEAGFLPYGELERWCADRKILVPQMIYLFRIGETDYFLGEVPEAFWTDETGPGPGYEAVRMIKVRAKDPKEQVFAAATAWHLYNWYRDNRYCGRCGGRVEADGRLRMLHCPACSNQIFPKIAPAIIVGVTAGERILMTKYANREYKRYALIAGFTEIGETAEETVAREVTEEVGLSVKNIRYYKSQPWGFDSNLLLGYFCELDEENSGTGITMDQEELAEAEWVHYSEITDDVEGLSLTREMMCAFRDAWRKKRGEIE